MKTITNNILYTMMAGILCMLVLVSCQKTTPVNEQEGPVYSAEVKKIIDEKNAIIVAWYQSGMIDSASQHFADNCIQMPPNQPAIKGIENYKAMWKQNVALGEWQFVLEAREVKASGNLATELGYYELTFEPNEGAPIPPMQDHGNYVVLWEKIDGDWKIVWDAPVSEVPLLAPPSTNEN